MICGCGGKKPEDDVALIKELLAKLERGVNQKNTTVLDSITQDKKQNIASQLLDSLSFGGKIENARIANKMFMIVGDSAEVRLRLGLRLRLKLATAGKETNEMEKPLKLFLHKKRGKWKIKSFNMASERQQ